MTDFEREDMELKALMGDKFVDETAPVAEKPKEKKKSANTTPAKKAAQKPAQRPADEESVDALWHPVKPHSWMDGLKACAKWALTFGGLNMLIFYWQQAGLMDASVAIPCQWVCCALAGYGVGLNVWRWSK
jgi:hypothetical protein